MDKEDVLIDIVEKVVEDAMISHKHTFKMYDYLTHNNLTKKEIQDFLTCGTAKNIRCTLDDLDLIIEGGHSYMKEAYPNWTKPEARKIRKYLYNILNDAEQYKQNKTRRIRSK
jgi:hypothetical protein|tara:strand:+ start:382 stop:720 length:339 start_codon:yes stop_codon:yes gene_type:complete